MNFTKELLENKKVSELKELCRQLKVPISGNKKELVTRILEWEEKTTKEKNEWDKLMAYGAEERDEGFERVISIFKFWSEENGFWPSKLGKSGVSYESVDINEIRAAFADYNPDTSSLRDDKLVPAPSTKLEVFLEMLFNERDDWVIFDTTNEGREFDSDSKFSDR